MKKNLEEFIRKIRFKNAVTLTESDVKASFEKIKQRIEIGAEVVLPAPRRISLFQTLPFKVAASVAVIVSLGLFGVNYYNSQKQIIIANTSNDVKEITLPDGTQIALRANSAITYRNNYTSKRALTLQGEAMFSVTKNPESPFTVTTAEGTVKVLGTVFTVRAYPAENYTKTVLKEGSIRFSDTNDKSNVILKPGEEAFIKENQAKIRVSKVKNMDRELAWKTRSFRFENEQLSEILEAISEAYNKNLHITTPGFKDKRYTLKFTHGEDLSKMLTVLSNVAGFSYQIDDKSVVISDN